MNEIKILIICLFISVVQCEYRKINGQVSFSNHTFDLYDYSDSGEVYLPSNVAIDEFKFLHLVMRQDKKTKQWTSAAAISRNNFNYGVYKWEIVSDLSTLGENARVSITKSDAYVANKSRYSEASLRYRKNPDDNHNAQFELKCHVGPNRLPSYVYRFTVPSIDYMSIYRLTHLPRSVKFEFFPSCYNGDFRSKALKSYNSVIRNEMYFISRTYSFNCTTNLAHEWEVIGDKVYKPVEDKIEMWIWNVSQPKQTYEVIVSSFEFVNLGFQ